MSIYNKWSKRTLINHKNKGCTINITPKELSVIATNILKCSICNRKLNWFDKNKLNGATLDRINNELLIQKDNIQIICKQCNNLKGTLTMDQYTKKNDKKNDKVNIYKDKMENVCIQIIIMEKNKNYGKK